VRKTINKKSITAIVPRVVADSGHSSRIRGTEA
jgi:hypothetical protein